MCNIRSQTCAWTLLIGVLWPTIGYSQQVFVGGQTLKWHGSTNYIPLPNVTVTVIRNGNQVGQTKSSGNDARYDMQVASGAPIEMIFHFGPDYIPVVQGLAAGASMKHDINTALLTVDQYEELRRENKSMPPIAARVSSVLMLIRNTPELEHLMRDMQLLNEKATNLR